MILSVWAAIWVIEGTHPFVSEFQGDSQVYLSTAQNIRQHGAPAAGFNLAWDGFAPNQAFAFHGRVPSTVFPPGYPLALAATSVFSR